MLAKFCALLTLAAASPSLIMEFQRPSSKTLPLCLSNVAMSFFLFSYQVHEKSILLPLLPISLSMHRSGELTYSRTIFNISLLSMFPLLKKDGLSLPYWGFQIFGTALNCLLSLEKNNPGLRWPRSTQDLINVLKELIDSPIAVIFSIFGVHLVCLIVQPLTSKEFLSDAIIVSFSFCYFFTQMILGNIYQCKLCKR